MPLIGARERAGLGPTAPAVATIGDKAVKGASRGFGQMAEHCQTFPDSRKGREDNADGLHFLEPPLAIPDQKGIPVDCFAILIKETLRFFAVQGRKAKTVEAVPSEKKADACAAEWAARIIKDQKASGRRFEREHV